jgi:hypothetical protein
LETDPRSAGESLRQTIRQMPKLPRPPRRLNRALAVTARPCGQLENPLTARVANRKFVKKMLPKNSGPSASTTKDRRRKNKDVRAHFLYVIATVIRHRRETIVKF